MKVEDVMTSDVVTVQPETSLKEVAAILADRRISGVPVVAEDGRVEGVVSEADILFKERGLSKRTGILALFTDPDHEMTLKLEARTAAEAMTAPAQTIASWRSVSAAAAQMLDESVNRLPVVDNGCLVGIVTRADLVRAFVRSDIEIEREIREEVLERGLLLEAPGEVAVAVDEGNVTLGGTLRRRTDAELVPALVARVPGVVGIESSIEWREDNGKHRSEPLVLGTRRGT